MKLKQRKKRKSKKVEAVLEALAKRDHSIEELAREIGYGTTFGKSARLVESMKANTRKAVSRARVEAEQFGAQLLAYQRQGEWFYGMRLQA